MSYKKTQEKGWYEFDIEILSGKMFEDQTSGEGTWADGSPRRSVKYITRYCKVLGGEHASDKAKLQIFEPDENVVEWFRNLRGGEVIDRALLRVKPARGNYGPALSSRYGIDQVK